MGFIHELLTLFTPNITGKEKKGGLRTVKADACRILKNFLFYQVFQKESSVYSCLQISADANSSLRFNQ